MMLACEQSRRYDDDMAILDDLRDALENCGRTRYRVSLESGINQSTLSRFARGHFLLTVETAERLADALGHEIKLTPKARTRKGK